MMARFIILFLFCLGFAAPPLAAAGLEKPLHIEYPPTPPAPRGQTPEQALAKSKSCISCHTKTDSMSMHDPEVVLGCTDCHGGDSTVSRVPYTYDEARIRAHVPPTLPHSWNSPKSRNPERSYTLLNRESPEFVRVVSPSDLRVAREACDDCPMSLIQA